MTKHGFDPGALDFGTTYYWKVDEVGAATYPGSVWSFTTQEYAVVDDFESYTDTEAAASTTAGSMAGPTTPARSSAIWQAPFAEQTIIHGGKQSMPFEYNNVKTPYYSEAERTFDTPAGSGPSAAPTPWRCTSWAIRSASWTRATTPSPSASSGTDIWGNADQFRFVYKSLSGNGSITAQVDSLTRTDAWSKAGVMIRESLEAGSKHAMVVMTPDSSASLQYRTNTGGVSANADDRPALAAPYWVRIDPHRQCVQGGALPGRQDVDPGRHRSERSRWWPTSTSVCA